MVTDKNLPTPASPDGTSLLRTENDATSETEVMIRRRAIGLVGEHWEELSERLARWLGQAFREDDTLAGEVALIVMARYRHGHGSLMSHLRDNPRCDAAEARKALFAEAKLVYREVLPFVVKKRPAQGRCTPLDPEIAPPRGDDTLGTFNLAGERGDSAKSDEQLVATVAVLLACGEEIWESFCVSGVLDRDQWTNAQKWTAIAMMWDLTIDQVAIVRQVKTGVSVEAVASREATLQLMSTVRRKSRLLREAM